MDTTTERTSNLRRGVVLGTLLLGTFMAGCAEQLVVGLLPLISAGLSVSIPAAGALVSANALGLAIGGPLLTAATIRLDRRRILIGSIGLFALLLAVPVVLPQYELFLVTRLVGGALQGLFMAAAFTTATASASPHRAGQAMSVVIAGFSVATVVGLPLGVLVGSVLGWRGALLAVVVGALLVGGLLTVVTPPVTAGSTAGLAAVRQALSPRVVAVLALAFVLFGGSGAVITYLMPVLHHSGISGSGVGGVLLAYGLASVLGSVLGGRIADRSAARGLIIAAVGTALCFATLLAVGQQPLVAMIVIVVFGLFTASAPPSIQYRAVSLAGPAGAFAASLPASAANAGIAVGAGVSGVAYATGAAPASITTGLVITLAALGLAVMTRRLRPAAGVISAAGSPVPSPPCRPGAERARLTPVA